jgi:hypothetical protein
MRKRLKLFVAGSPIGGIRAVFGTPVAGFGGTVCPGQHGEKGPIFGDLIKTARAG